MKAKLITLALGLTLGIAFTTHAQKFSAQELTARAIHRRAVEAVIWGVPAVNYQRMLDAAIASGAQPNQVVCWSQPLNAKTQTLTPNPDTIYFQPFYDTTKGPMVLEIPPSDGDSVIVGSVDNSWQIALEDVGIAGVDKGKGGKYLITPPGYQDKAPDGYILMPSDTYRGFAILRSNYKSRADTDIARAVEHGKGIRFYPLGGNPDSTVFVDVYDKPYDATIPYDATFFESLDRFVQAEPWLTRDKAMINPLKTLGIEKGQPLQLDAKVRTTLDAAAKEARAHVNLKYEQGFNPPFFTGTHWALPLEKDAMEGIPSNFADPNSYAIDGRAVIYSIAYFSAKHLGAGQYYLVSLFDQTGQPFAGKKTYRLTVPANPPVKQYWSVTAYDRETHALIRGTSRSSRGSNVPDLQKNADGSTDIYLGPTAPAGKESNWVPTNGRDFELLFRFYGPEKTFFEKQWKLPDVEKVK